MPSLSESLGLHPLPERLRQARIALTGAEDVPKSQFGLSSLRLLAPRLSIPLWRGHFKTPRRVVLTNLFNHRQTPVEEGWSVKKRQVEDFRGRSLTYDSHNGTDLSIPRGTTVVAPAAGRIARIFAEFNRGGLKMVIDHGEGLLTCAAHLARALVQEGDEVQVGQAIALSGYSGLDGLTTFPFGIPHVHFNVWFNGEPVDPFAHHGEPSLWINDYPQPAPREAPHETYVPPVFDEAVLSRVIEACKTPSVRQSLRAIPSLEQRGLQVISERNYYPTRFVDTSNIYTQTYARRPRIYMPFSESDVDGADLFDEM